VVQYVFFLNLSGLGRKEELDGIHLDLAELGEAALADDIHRLGVVPVDDR
jgi:hypothetical protein